MFGGSVDNFGRSKMQKIFCQCTKMGFSSGFITAAVVNPPERKLAKHTSVHWSKLYFSLDALPEIRILNWLYYWNFLLCMLHAKLQTIFSEFFRLVLNPSLVGECCWQPISLVEFWIIAFLAFIFSQEQLGLLLEPL